MDAFNFVKDIFEFAYYIVGVLGLITIYISVKNNIDVKKEKQELKNEKLELKKRILKSLEISKLQFILSLMIGRRIKILLFLLII